LPGKFIWFRNYGDLSRKKPLLFVRNTVTRFCQFVNTGTFVTATQLVVARFVFCCRPKFAEGHDHERTALVAAPAMFKNGAGCET